MTAHYYQVFAGVSPEPIARAVTDNPDQCSVTYMGVTCSLSSLVLTLLQGCHEFRVQVEPYSREVYRRLVNEADKTRKSQLDALRRSALLTELIDESDYSLS